MRCKIAEQAEKQKLRGPKSATEDQPARQYTVVSKMPKDTKLQVNVKCPKCELKFFKANLLEEHLKLHDGKKAKQCPICQKSFNSNYHFKTHMRTHSHVKPFCCAVKVCANHCKSNLKLSLTLQGNQKLKSMSSMFSGLPKRICRLLITASPPGDPHRGEKFQMW